MKINREKGIHYIEDIDVPALDTYIRLLNPCIFNENTIIHDLRLLREHLIDIRDLLKEDKTHE